MSFWSNLTSALFSGLKTAGRVVMNVAGPALGQITEAARKVFYGAMDGINKAFVSPPATERERIDRDLNDTNELLDRLRDRYRRDGKLTPTDQAQNRHLMERRQNLLDELEALDKVDLAEELVEAEGDIEAFEITEAQFHMLQYQVGQNSLNKVCAVCGRKMGLQWDNKLLVVQRRSQFFWGCSGFYVAAPYQCTHTEQLCDADFKVLLNTRRSEFECTPAELAAVTFEKNPERVRNAIRSIRSKLQKKRQGVDGYRCPVHGERLKIREKRDPIGGLHDQFFLGCPRWLPNDQGCNYLVKLKSAAQISAFLEAGGETGVISVLGLGANPVSQQGKKWYPEDEQRLMDMVKAGKTVDEIALLMHRKRGGIAARMERLGFGESSKTIVAPSVAPSAISGEVAEKTFVPCKNCLQLLRVPKGKHLEITCPTCRHRFEMRT